MAGFQENNSAGQQMTQSSQTMGQEEQELLRSIDPGRIVQAADQLGRNAIVEASSAANVLQENAAELQAVLPAIEQNMNSAFSEMDEALLNLDQIDANPIISKFKGIFDPEFDREKQIQKLQRAQTRVQTNQMRVNLLQTHNQLQNKAAMAPLETSLMQLEVLQDLQGFRTGQIQQENARLQQNSARIQLRQLAEEEALARADTQTILTAYEQKRPDMIGPNVSMGRLEQKVMQINKLQSDMQKASQAAKKGQLEFLAEYKTQIGQNWSLPEVSSHLVEARKSPLKKTEVAPGVFFTESELARLESEKLSTLSESEQKTSQLITDLTAFDEATAFNSVSIANAINGGTGDIVVTPDMFTTGNNPMEIFIQRPELLTQIENPELRNAMSEVVKMSRQADVLGRTAQEKIRIMKQAQEKAKAAFDKFHEEQLETAAKDDRPAIREFQQMGKVNSSSAAISYLGNVVADVNAVDSSKDEPLNVAYQTFQDNLLRELGGIELSEDDLEDMSPMEKLAFLQKLGETPDKERLLRISMSPAGEGKPNPQTVYAAQHSMQLLHQAVLAVGKEIPELQQLINPTGRRFAEVVLDENGVFKQDLLLEALGRLQQEAVKKHGVGAQSAIIDRVIAKANELLPAYLKEATIGGYTGTVENAAFYRMLTNNNPRILIQNTLNGFAEKGVKLQQQLQTERKQRQQQELNKFNVPGGTAGARGFSAPQSFNFSIFSGGEE